MKKDYIHNSCGNHLLIIYYNRAKYDNFFMRGK